MGSDRNGPGRNAKNITPYDTHARGGSGGVSLVSSDRFSGVSYGNWPCAHTSPNATGKIQMLGESNFQPAGGLTHWPVHNWCSSYTPTFIPL